MTNKPNTRESALDVVKTQIVKSEAAGDRMPYLIACRMVSTVNELVDYLNELPGFKAIPFRASMSTSERFAALQKFNLGEVQALVGTSLMFFGYSVKRSYCASATYLVGNDDYKQLTSRCREPDTCLGFIGISIRKIAAAVSVTKDDLDTAHEGLVLSMDDETTNSIMQTVKGTFNHDFK